MSQIRYLGTSEVRQLLPAPQEQLRLVRTTLEAMRRGECQLPPKPAIYPRDDAFIHAMPAYVRGTDTAVLKWIGGSAANRERGLPYLSGLIVINDSETAAPVAIMDAGEITAARTAAVTAICIERFAVRRWQRVSIIGFGVQGRAHGRLLEAINPDVQLTVVQREQSNGSDGTYRSSTDAREAIADADIIVTAIRLRHPPNPFVKPAWIRDGQLLAPIDFDAAVSPNTVHEADAFVVDDLTTFSYYQERGYFQGWPEPSLSLAEALDGDMRANRPVCCNLGVATLDAAFAKHVLDRATTSGIGLLLQ